MKKPDPQVTRVRVNLEDGRKMLFYDDRRKRVYRVRFSWLPGVVLVIHRSMLNGVAHSSLWAYTLRKSLGSRVALTPSGNILGGRDPERAFLSALSDYDIQ